MLVCVNIPSCFQNLTFACTCIYLLKVACYLHSFKLLEFGVQ